MRTSTKTQSYELTFILDEKAGQEEGVKKTAEITALIEKAGGKVTKEEPWGRRELAYLIKRNRHGYYVTLWLDIPSVALKDLERELLFDTGIIRSLITKAYTEAQPGSLYPVDEEKEEKNSGAKEEAVSGEEMLRRSTTPSSKKDIEEDMEELIPEEERLKKLDETLEELLKDEE